MNTYQFYSVFAKNEIAKIKIDELTPDKKDAQIKCNNEEVRNLADFLYDKLTTMSISQLVAHIVKRYKEGENAQSNRG